MQSSISDRDTFESRFREEFLGDLRRRAADAGWLRGRNLWTALRDGVKGLAQLVFGFVALLFGMACQLAVAAVSILALPLLLMLPVLFVAGLIQAACVALQAMGLA